MRPLRSFLLLLLLLTCLTGLSFLFPATGFFPPVNYFIPSFLTSGLSHKTLPASNLRLADTVFPVTEETIAPDSVTSAEGYLEKIPLSSFLDSLRGSKGQVRIMYYGDSQVEGDRMTFFLRQLLRQGRGGTGPGLFLPVMPVMYSKSLWIRSSSNWKRYNYLSFKEGAIKSKSLGPFMTKCRYLPEGDSTVTAQKASVRIRPSGFADDSAAYFDRLRIFYSNPDGETAIYVRTGDMTLFSGTLPESTEITGFSCQLKGSEEISIEFEGRFSPDIFGMSIESETGVIVDNLPQRGSAGLEFTMVDRKNLEQSYRLLSPDLIVLHYGLNIVKNIRDDYTYYKRGLGRQLTLLSEIVPGIPVLVVGVTDMAFKEGDSLRSYQNIPHIITAQAEAAKETGAWFWDAYKAMGGAGSIIAWAGKKPPQAQQDYVHFTYSGADTLSKMLVNEIIKPDTGVISSAAPLISIADTIRYEGAVFEDPSGVNVSENQGFDSLIRLVFRYDPEKPFIFTTVAFWLFLLIVLAGYSILYRKPFLRNLYLLLVSLFFYFKTGGLFLLLLIFVSLIDFACGILIHNSGKRAWKKFFIVFSILSNIGILAYFKYSAFLITSINDLFGTDLRVYDLLASVSNDFLGTNFDISSIILPVGISFFTFQSLSYTIDVYRGKLEPVRNFVDFGFYVSFFPQLVAGPIVRASEFIPQLYSEYSLSKREFSHAMFLVMKGLIKKIVISDFLATNLIDRVFEFPALYSGFENLMAVYAYGLQIYCDFSGYTDIAIGIGLLFGFRLPVNFNSPYKAAGVADFWKRWHISLSRWLKDYLYIPLGGNKKGQIRTGINLILTMLLGGLWHGASIRFIIWGGLHGIGLVINKIWDSLVGHRMKTGRPGRAFMVFLTFNFVSFCWIFFRAPDMDSVALMLKQIFENFSPGSYSAVLPAYGKVFVAMAVGYLIHFLPEKVKESYRGLFITIPLGVQLIIILAFAVLLYQMRSPDVLPFIYFRF